MAELERGMSDRELRDWYRFAAQWPLPDTLADVHAASLMAVVANIARSADSAPFLASDFMVLGRQAADEPETPEAFYLSEAERFRRGLSGG